MCDLEMLKRGPELKFGNLGLTKTISSISSCDKEVGDHATIEVKDGNDVVEDGNDAVEGRYNEIGDHATIEFEDEYDAIEDGIVAVEDGNDAVEDGNDTVEGGNDPVVISIKEKFEGLSSLSSKCCIYTVPECLRKINPEAYTPLMVSIGPLHRGLERLQAMKEHKLRFLKCFVSHCGLHLEDYVKFVREMEERVRSCYAESIKLGSDEFVHMILVDGSFLVQVVLSCYFNCTATADILNRFDKPDPIFHLRDDHKRMFSYPGLSKQIGHDLLLLENQLPFFVLDGLFHMWLVSNGCRHIPLIEFCPVLFKHITKTDKLPDGFSGCEVNHFVDFLLLYYLPSHPAEDNDYATIVQEPPTVTELHEAGVRFKKGTNNCLLGIQFDKGVLEIQHFDVFEMREIMFRNLIAFEQCKCLGGTIVNYILFMDGLIDTPKDVDLLIKNKIITNHLGSSEDISKMFNNIGKGVSFYQNPYFRTLCEKLNVYCKARKHRWKAILRRDYFNTPWKIISIIVAVILLLLTCIQAVCSILSL